MLVIPAPVPPTGNLLEPAVEFPALEVVDQRLDFALVVHHELDVVPGGEAQIAVAVLVCDFADFADDARRS